MGNSLIAPDVVIRPITALPSSVNQSRPSGPVTIQRGRLFGNDSAKDETTPDVVIRPIAFACAEVSTNHRLPSGPTVISSDAEFDGTGYWWSMVPFTSITSMVSWHGSAIQRLPSGPVTRLVGQWRNPVIG